MALRSTVQVKNAMLAGTSIGQLQAYDINGNICSDSITTGVSWTASGGAYTLNSAVTLAIEAGATVKYVKATESGDPDSAGIQAVEIDLTENEAFPDGGNLIVEEFTMNLGDA